MTIGADSGRAGNPTPVGAGICSAGFSLSPPALAIKENEDMDITVVGSGSATCRALGTRSIGELVDLLRTATS